MLKSLHIENIAVAKQLNIEFKGGFSVLTGQTGSGKSVVIDSIALLTGAKADRELIRFGESTASVSAIFEGEPNTGCFDENGEEFIERTVSSDGRSGAKINGKSMTLSQYREAVAPLVALHGQNETVKLYDKNECVLFLDSYAGINSKVDEYREVYTKIQNIRRDITELEKNLDDKSMMTDILKYQISEIEKAKITDPEETEKLEKLRTKLKNTEQITKSAGLVWRALASSDKNANAAYLLERASAALYKLTDVMDNAASLAAKLEEYRIEIIDIAEQTKDILDDIGDSPEERLDKIETRLSLLSKLTRKYGGDLEAVMAFRDDAKRKLKDLEAGDDRLEEMRYDLEKLEEAAYSIGLEIREMRTKYGKRLSDEVMSVLKYLDMPKVRFTVEITPAGEGKDRFAPRGIDSVDFYVMTNPGEDSAPISKIASGGELSRIMLALKCAEAEKSGTGVIIFDEIDTGVSGGTSERIGMKLSELSEKCQVICVTHSAQVASHAMSHLLIEKKEVGGRAESFVREITGEDRVREVARIIGGITITEKQTVAARELLGNK